MSAQNQASGFADSLPQLPALAYLLGAILAILLGAFAPSKGWRILAIVLAVGLVACAVIIHIAEKLNVV